MSFNPKAMAAMKYKDAQIGGKVPLNPSNPQNIAKQIPNLVPTSPIPANPMASATMSAFKPQVPGMPVVRAPGTGMNPDQNLAMKRFGNLRKKLSGI